MTYGVYNIKYVLFVSQKGNGKKGTTILKALNAFTNSSVLT